MLSTILRINWLNLKRDRVALMLTFVLPIAFFSIFAYIFGSLGSGNAMNNIRVVAVDLDQTETSKQFLAELGVEGGGLSLRYAPADRADEPYTRDEAVALVRDGKYPVAVVVPKGFADSFGSFGINADAPPVEVIYDDANPVASQMTTGLMQKAAMTAAPDLMMERGLEQLDEVGTTQGFDSTITPGQREAMEFIKPYIRGEKDWGELGDGQSTDPAAAASNGNSQFQGFISVDAHSVHNESTEEQRAATAFYAAGTGVMFLLFSMAGAAGTLLEEEESGALDRLLNSSLGMGGLLLGKWGFFALIGFLQVSLMFLWGWAVFGIDLLTPYHLVPFVAMTIVTACAASAFGMMLATACRSRAQLGGVSTIVILIMSAVGGSMFPRFMMPEGLQTAGLATFNGWALDGYLKTFWYDDPNAGVLGSVVRLWPQLTVLAGATVAFLVVSRLLARRWEVV